MCFTVRSFGARHADVEAIVTLPQNIVMRKKCMQSQPKGTIAASSGYKPIIRRRRQRNVSTRLMERFICVGKCFIKRVAADVRAATPGNSTPTSRQLFGVIRHNT